MSDVNQQFQIQMQQMQQQIQNLQQTNTQQQQQISNRPVHIVSSCFYIIFVSFNDIIIIARHRLILI